MLVFENLAHAVGHVRLFKIVCSVLTDIGILPEILPPLIQVNHCDQMVPDLPLLGTPIAMSSQYIY